MFSKDVTWAEPTKPLTCDASAWGQVSEKRTHRWRGTGIRDCVPGSRATASSLQPLHKHGHSAPRPPGAAQLLPRAGGRAPCREMGHDGSHPGLFLQKLREGGCPTWEEGRTREVTKTGKTQSPSPRHWKAQALRTPPPKGGRLTRPPAWGPQALPPSPRPGRARAQPTCRPRGGRARLPHRFVPHPGRARLGPSPPARPPRPGGRWPNVSRPARPSPPSPQGRTLRGAFPAPQPLGAPPLRPSCERPSPPWPASAACVPAPLPQPSPFYACAPRGPGPEGAWPREAPLGAPRLRLAGLRRAPSYRPTVATQPGATVQVASGFWVP